MQLLLALALTGSAYAICPATPDALEAMLKETVQAYADLDRGAFGRARDASRQALLCLDAPISAAQAGAYHRMEGLNGLISRDEQKTLNAFLASVAVDPYWEMPQALAPEGHPLREAYEQAQLAPPSATVAVEIPGCTALFVDGVRTTVRPSDRPSILQLTSEEDLAVLWSGYLAPPAEPPGWSALQTVAALDCARPLAAGELPESRERLSGILLTSAGGTALVSGGLATWALVTRARYLDRDFEDSAAGETIRERANGVYYTAQGTAALAVSLGGAGMALRIRW